MKILNFGLLDHSAVLNTMSRQLTDITIDCVRLSFIHTFYFVSHVVS